MHTCVCVCVHGNVGQRGRFFFFFPVEEIHIKTLRPSPTYSKHEWIIVPVSGFLSIWNNSAAGISYHYLAVISICKTVLPCVDLIWDQVSSLNMNHFL